MKHSLTLLPIITEKSMGLAQSRWYTFKVAAGFSKPQIATAIEDQFNVHVTNIKTIVMKGKQKRNGRKRIVVQMGNWKKAMVRLKDNESIGLFSVEEKSVSKPVAKK